MTEFATRDGVTLAYETAGRGDPPMVFVHGWCCDRSYVAPQFEHFASRHAVAAVDLRGHGQSEQPDPTAGAYDVETLADDVLAVATAAGIDRPVMVGHSLGAVVALACATRPGAVRAAVMIDPAPLMNDDAKTYLRRAADDVAADDRGTWRRGFADGMFLATDRVRREEIIDGMSERPPAIAAAALRAMAGFDGGAALGRVDVPVVSIGSAVPSDTAADLRAACPSITIGQTVGSGHFNQLQVPDQVNRMIERFLVIHDW